MQNRVKLIDKESGHYVFFCPGCKYSHSITTLKENPQGAKWGFNGSIDKPTFTPSILVNKDSPEYRCHSYVTDGKIKYLEDCFHELKGTTVDLPDYNC